MGNIDIQLIISVTVLMDIMRLVKKIVNNVKPQTVKNVINQVKFVSNVLIKNLTL